MENSDVSLGVHVDVKCSISGNNNKQDCAYKPISKESVKIKTDCDQEGNGNKQNCGTTTVNIPEESSIETNCDQEGNNSEQDCAVDVTKDSGGSNGDNSGVSQGAFFSESFAAMTGICTAVILAYDFQ